MGVFPFLFLVLLCLVFKYNNNNAKRAIHLDIVSSIAFIWTSLWNPSYECRLAWCVSNIWKCWTFISSYALKVPTILREKKIEKKNRRRSKCWLSSAKLPVVDERVDCSVYILCTLKKAWMVFKPIAHILGMQFKLNNIEMLKPAHHLWSIFVFLLSHKILLRCENIFHLYIPIQNKRKTTTKCPIIICTEKKEMEDKVALVISTKQ